MAYIQTSTLIAAPLPEVFAHVSDFKHLPEWLGESIQVSFNQIPPAMKVGGHYEMQMTRFGFTQTILLRIEQFKKNEFYVDRQVQGFFQSWVHTQKVSRHDAKTTLLTDIVEYKMPFGLLGQLADDLLVRVEMTRLLNQRYERIAAQF